MMTDACPKTVVLKDGRAIQLRLLARDDFDRLYAFFRSLPEEDRIFLRDDVCDEAVVRRWTENLDFERVVPLVALEGDEIIGDGTLHIETHGWMRHVAHLRLVTARTHRHLGLGGLIARELVALASEHKIEKLQTQFIEDNVGAVKMFEALGFEKIAVLRDMVKDLKGQKQNLVIMLNDVANLGRIMEDWILDSMIPSFRVPGAGA